MKLKQYSHLNADATIPESTARSARDAVESTSFAIGRHSTAALRRAIISEFVQRGWASEVSIGNDSSNKVSGLRGRVGLCVQTGNTAALYRDLFKLLYLYSTDSIAAGVYVVPTAAAAKVLGSNYASMEHLVGELRSYSRVIPVPILVLGFSG